MTRPGGWRMWVSWMEATGIQIGVSRADWVKARVDGSAAHRPGPVTSQ